MSQSLSLSPSIIDRLSFRQRATSVTIGFWQVALFLLAHVAIAPLLRQVTALAMLHVAVVTTLGLWWAISEKKNIVRVAYIGAYITGAEVLWRMTQAPLPWEFGKYATSLIFLVAILRHQLFKIPLLAIALFVPLTISIPLTIEGAFRGTARGEISFYMSGPLAFMFCAWFFSKISLSVIELKRLLLALIAPILGIATIALVNTVTAESIRFESESNKVTSGGFAPNQVSAVLGLGAFIALLCVLSGHLPKKLRVLLFGVIIFLGTQSALTFSRGGLYMAGGATIVALFYLVRSRQMLITTLLVGSILFVVANYVVLPELESFTDGAITERFQKKSLTGRGELLEGELNLFLENPIMGVGPGMSRYYRKPLWVSSHTEYSRFLAEHGIFGLSVIISLLVAIWKNLKRNSTHLSKAVVAAFSLWSLLFMFSAAMRLVAPAFIFGVCFTTFLNSGTPRLQLALQRLKKLRERLVEQNAI